MAADYSVFGLGKLGASMVAAMAKRGLSVVGYDVLEASVQKVNDGHAPVQETDLEEILQQYREHVSATSDPKEAVLASDMTFVIVPTPSGDNGAFRLDYAQSAFREIGKALKEKDGYHVVVLTSTVLPGSMRHGLLPILEEESGKRCGPDFGLCYSPEFIALGSIIRNFLNPDFTLVGEFDERSGAALEEAYKRIMENDPPCKRMTLENAELAKVSLNAFVTTKITFANMLADICERLPGGDVDAVTNAIGTDLRIGRKYLTGALGYGGPCFPRDNVALAWMARTLGGEALISENTDRLNRNLADKLVDDLKSEIESGTRVAVLGLSYKPCSHVLEESQSIAMIRALLRAGASVTAYDPLAHAMNPKEIPDGTTVAASIEKCLSGAQVVLVTTPDAAYKDLPASAFPQGCKVIDYWRILKDTLAACEDVTYVPFGCGRDDAAAHASLKEIWG